MIIVHDDKETIACFLRVCPNIDAEAKDIEKIEFNTETGQASFTLVAPLESFTQTIQLGQ